MIKDLFIKLSNHPKRLFHVITVGLVSKSLAIKYGLDDNKAYIAGLLHDYSKYETIQFHKKYLSSSELLNYSEFDLAYHGISAANYFLKNYNLDHDIYNAVYNHVAGRPSMSELEKILFIADSVYFTGENNSHYIYQKALHNLNEAVLLSIENTFNYLKKDKLIPSKFQIETYEYYLKEEKTNEQEK